MSYHVRLVCISYLLILKKEQTYRAYFEHNTEKCILKNKNKNINITRLPNVQLSSRDGINQLSRLRFS